MRLLQLDGGVESGRNDCFYRLLRVLFSVTENSIVNAEGQGHRKSFCHLVK